MPERRTPRYVETIEIAETDEVTPARGGRMKPGVLYDHAGNVFRPEHCADHRSLNERVVGLVNGVPLTYDPAVEEWPDMDREWEAIINLAVEVEEEMVASGRWAAREPGDDA